VHEKPELARPDRRRPFSLIAGIVVVVIGLMLGWKTSTQFSDGFFWAGAIMILVGLISLLGYGERNIFAPSITPSASPPDHLDPAERSRLGAADTFRGKGLLAFLGMSGLLLFGLSYLTILIGKLL
jgi:hypothetical protein